MMNVRLLNTYSTRNLGDAAIYAALARLAAEHGARTLAPSPVAPDCSLEPGAFVSVGGDIFNNGREWLASRTFVRNLRTLHRAPAARTMVFGQSLPRSCHGLAFVALARTMRRLAAVSVRDAGSHRRLVAAGVPARLGLDTAFALAPAAHWDALATRMFDAAGIRPERAALISLRSFDAMYRQDTDALLGRLHALCSLLRRRGHLPAVLVQSDVDAADTDRAPLARLRSQLPWLGVLDPFAISGAEHWEAAAAAARAARLVIAVRYHTGVFRMLGGRQAFHLHYSGKGADLVQRLDQPGCALDALDPAQAIGAIEATADAAVDAGALRAATRADFAACWHAATEASAHTARLSHVG